MNNQDEISPISLPAASSASVSKKFVKVVVLAHKSYVYDQLGVEH